MFVQDADSPLADCPSDSEFSKHSFLRFTTGELAAILHSENQSAIPATVFAFSGKHYPKPLQQRLLPDHEELGRALWTHSKPLFAVRVLR
jgi:hypothetical protein